MQTNESSNRKTARIAGILFIIATVASILSTPFLAPINSLNYLKDLSSNPNQTLIGAFLVIIAAIASGSIAISLYPTLKKYNQSLALGAVGFRLIEAALYIIGVITIILLLTLSQDFVLSGAPSSSYFQSLGTVLLSGYHWASFVGGPLVFCIGALLYYIIFYQTKLVPRWLSIWGLVGVTLCILSSILVMFNVIGAFSPTQVVLNLPFIGVQEMVLAVWLIVKGFRSQAITLSANQRSDRNPDGQD